jgi:hypothetical protein
MCIGKALSTNLGRCLTSSDLATKFTQDNKKIMGDHASLPMTQSSRLLTDSGQHLDWV